MLIAQLSDIHAAPDNLNLTRLDNALTWLTPLNPDVLVLSGDLIDNGWYEGYQRIAERLATFNCRIIILPGNADDRGAMRAVWGPSMWPEAPDNGPLHAVVDTPALRIIGLDSTLEGRAAGSVDAHLSWLSQQLNGACGRQTLLFLHHHVFESGIPTMDALMCQGRDALGVLLGAHPARPLAIATGHVHRPAAGMLAGIPAYICGSICPANPLWLGEAYVPEAGDLPALIVHRYAHDALASHFISVTAV
ncbi:metallophosphoesterase (plasmid) [Cronobacter condimenti 1330]|uniref:Metallophosphoesterase n=3 Tax=Cronobacter condimenti TaxID=1163710 RepID=A0ABN4IEJ8_9ENTR|nr:metallophosphoesterase [Cronobacter condimenti]ALB64883.1 metallophosphoesterase [Cronobacter condimenti 1330]